MPELLLSLLAHAAAEPHPDARRGALPAGGRLVLGPGALIGAIGLLAPGTRPAALPAQGTRARVDVAIPLRRDQASIVYCLAGLHAQHLRPRRIVFIDDGAERDGTLVLAREFAAANGISVELRCLPPGAEPSAVACLFDGDALLMLDGGTVLDSPDYLERCLRVLQGDAGLAGVSGAALPLRDEDRRAWARSDAFRRWVGGDEYRDPCAPRSDVQRLGRWFADAYRESVALVQQCLAQRQRMSWPTRGLLPAGATLYRREALQSAPATAGAGVRGDPPQDAGRAGLRVAQRAEVRARTQPRAVAGPPGPMRAALPRSDGPGADAGRAPPGPGADPRTPGDRLAAPGADAGPARSSSRGRAAWLGPIEGLMLPVLATTLLVVGGWRWVAAVALVELALWLLVLALVAPARPLATLAKGLLVAPLRYVEIAAGAVDALRALVARPR